MQLFVHCGSRHLVTVPDDATVDAITEFIETTEGILRSSQYVVHNGRPLAEDNGSLEANGVSSLSTLTVGVRMAGGAKHGKNRSANPVISAHERTMDAETEGYGTRKRRAGGISILPFDCCCLSSQPPRNPVITPEGYLFDRECILENLLHQKHSIDKQMLEYEAQRQRWDKQRKQELEDEQTKKKEAFMKRERSASSVGNHFTTEKAEVSQAGKMLAMKKETYQTEKGKVVPKLPSFWLPSLTPGARETEVKPPNTKTLCPMSGKPLKVKHLITVKFTMADKHSKEALEAREERHVCALTQKFLRNSVKCVCLKPSGNVITAEAFERLVKPDMIEPITGAKLKPKDIIHMKTAGTGFAQNGAEIKKLKTAIAMGT